MRRMAMEKQGAATKCEGSAALCHATAMRSAEARRSSKAVNGGGVALRIAAVETRSGSVQRGTGAWTRACRMAEGPGLRTGQRAVTASEPPA